MPGRNRIALNGFWRMWPSYIGSLFANTDTFSRAPEAVDLPYNNSQTLYEAVRQKDNTFTLHTWENLPHVEPYVEDMPVYHDRYWNRQFPKGYQKKQKAKRRAQKQARRNR